MAFDPNDFVPKPTTWFSTKIKYHGLGRAEFENPSCWIEGKANVVLNEKGYCVLTLHTTKIVRNQVSLAKSAHMSFLASLNYGGTSCTRLLIDTKEGHFEALEPIAFSPTFGEPEVVFHSPRSQFDVRDRSSADVTYWVVPLVNFLSNFNFISPELSRHPLRLLKSPDISSLTSEMTENERIMAEYTATRNFVIAFDFRGTSGFIEPLLNYRKSEDGLHQRKISHAITAIMVGETLDNSIDWQSIEKWHLLDFMSLLGLATGRVVSTTWIEFRSANGDLIRRLHFNAIVPQMNEGYDALDGHGIGELLSVAPSSEMFHSRHLQTAIDLLIEGNSTPYIENRLNYLCRALETLSKVSKKPVKLVNILETSRYKRLKHILKEAQKELNQLQRDAKMDPKRNKAEVKTLEKIRLPSSKSKDLSFEDSVIQMLESYRLHDITVLDDYLRSNPRAENKSNWASVLNAYRNIVTHNAFFRYEEGIHSDQHVAQFTYHLYDLMLRLFLKMLGYEDKYWTRFPTQAYKDVDWVTEHTMPNELGYR